MIKNVCHEIYLANTRNELIELIDSKHIVIEISDLLLKEFENEYEKEKKNYKEAKFMRNMSFLAFLLGPAAPAYMIIMGGVTLFSGLVSAGYGFKKYAMTSFVNDGKRHTFLIRYRKFNDSYDTINGFESLHFSNSKKCPKCDNKFKIDKKTTYPIICQKCGAKIVMYVK